MAERELLFFIKPCPGMDLDNDDDIHMLAEQIARAVDDGIDRRNARQSQ